MQGPCPHCGQIGKIDAQQLARDQFRRIVGKVVNPGDDGVGGDDKAPSRPPADERGIIEEAEPARPGEGSEKAPDTLEFARLFRGHRATTIPSRARCAPARSSTPFAKPGSLPAKNA